MAASDNLRLTLVSGNYSYSSWSYRAWLALRHAGLAFDVRPISLFSPAGKDALKKESPSGLVPVLRVEEGGRGFDVNDSLAIMDVAARLAPDARFWPAGLAAFGLAKSMVAEMHSGFVDLRARCPMNIGRRAKKTPSSPPLSRDIARVQHLWQSARRLREGEGPFLFGDWGAADIAFAPVVDRFLTYGISVPDDLQPYIDAVLARADVGEWRALAASETDRYPGYDELLN